MCLAGVSTRRIEDVSELLWGAPASSGTVSNLNERAFASIEARRQGPLDGGCPYVFVDGIYLERSRGGPYENVAVPVAIGADSAGDREVIGCSEGYTESAESWRELLSWLKGRGLSGARLATGDRCAGMPGALEEVFPGARHRRRTVHFYRNVPGRVPVTGRKAAARMLKAIHAQESREACGRKAGEVADELESMRLGAAARTVRDGFAETLAYTEFPPEQDEQRDRAHRPRDREEDEGRRDLPGRRFGPHAGDGGAEVHSGARVGTWTCPNWRRRTS